jgi:hypothetical protein
MTGLVLRAEAKFGQGSVCRRKEERRQDAGATKTGTACRGPTTALGRYLGKVFGFYFEEAGDDGGGLLPVVGFGLKGFAAGFGEVVEAGAAIVVGGAPFGFDGAFLFEFEEDRVERALIDGEEVAADLFNAAGKAVAVERAEDVEGFEDHEGESALEDVGFFVCGRRGHLGIQQEDGTGPLGKQQGSFWIRKPKAFYFLPPRT